MWDEHLPKKGKPNGRVKLDRANWPGALNATAFDSLARA